MGNKLCKKKTDTGDNPKSPTPFDRIINRLHLRPNSWKSESQLDEKQVNRYEVNSVKPKNTTKVHPLSKSSDWTEVSLEVPDKDEPIHLRNPKLSLIFNTDDSIPTPPPRKHKKGFREKLEAVAKNGLQAFQAKKPVEEPLCTKKIVNHTCPLDEHDCAIHNRDHKHPVENPKQISTPKLSSKGAKRRKNLSVVSLPNYNEFIKLTVANFEDIDKKPETRNSLISLPGESKKLTSASSTGKLETYMTRCRSFGSLLPQQLLDKLKVRKIPTDNESDDSFGALEDWDLRIIEHYNPKEASLPRPRKVDKRTEKDVISDIESLIVNDVETQKPVPPVRRADSLNKAIKRKEVDACPKVQNIKSSPFVPLVPSSKIEPVPKQLPQKIVNNDSNGVVEHSSLLRILEEFSLKDKAENSENRDKNDNNELSLGKTEDSSNFSSLSPSLKEFERNVTNVERSITTDFINAEKSHIENDLFLSNKNLVTT